MTASAKPGGQNGSWGEKESVLLTGLALAAQLFWGPEPELCRDMVRGGFGQDLEALAARLEEPGRTAAEALRDWPRNREEEEVRSILEDEYIRLFVNAKEGLRAPLYHSHYESEDGSLMGRPYVMMTGRLEAAGIDLGAKTGEPADHLAVELEYLFLLLETGTTRNREDLWAEGREFAAEEMLPWVKELARRLEEEETGSFYPAAAVFLVSLLKTIVGRTSP